MTRNKLNLTVAKKIFPEYKWVEINSHHVGYYPDHRKDVVFFDYLNPVNFSHMVFWAANNHSGCRDWLQTILMGKDHVKAIATFIANK